MHWILKDCLKSVGIWLSDQRSSMMLNSKDTKVGTSAHLSIKSLREAIYYWNVTPDIMQPTDQHKLSRQKLITELHPVMLRRKVIIGNEILHKSNL